MFSKTHRSYGGVAVGVNRLRRQVWIALAILAPFGDLVSRSFSRIPHNFLILVLTKINDIVCENFQTALSNVLAFTEVCSFPGLSIKRSPKNPASFIHFLVGIPNFLSLLNNYTPHQIVRTPLVGSFLWLEVHLNSLTTRQNAHLPTAPASEYPSLCLPLYGERRAENHPAWPLWVLAPQTLSQSLLCCQTAFMQ